MFKIGYGACLFAVVLGIELWDFLKHLLQKQFAFKNQKLGLERWLSG